MTVPFAFANLSGNIALAKLDSNFNTPITIGNTSVLLGNTITTINNVTLANVTITSGTSNVTNVNVTNITVTNLTATLANVTTLNVSSASITSANIGTLALTNALSVPNGGTGQVTFPANSVLVGNGTGGIAAVAPGNVGNVLTSIGGAWVSNAVVTNAAAGANTQIQYNSANLLAGSANLTFDGTNLSVGTTALSGGKFSALVDLTAGNGLVVRDSATTYANNDNYVLLQNSTGATAGGLTHPASQSLGVWGFDDIRFIQGSTSVEQMRLTSTGLGIGTSSPSQKLQITASGASPAWLYSTNATSGSYFGTSGTGETIVYQTGAYPIQFYTNSTERMRLDSSGNLGIGATASASAILDAQSTTKGVRMPNMTTTQKNAISSPAAGLMVFDTTLAKLCVYSGSAWQTITSV